MLDPSLRRCEWTEAEDVLLIALVKRYGKKWTEIAEQLDGRCVVIHLFVIFMGTHHIAYRSSNQIKNRYYSLSRRGKKPTLLKLQAEAKSLLQTLQETPGLSAADALTVAKRALEATDASSEQPLKRQHIC